MSKFPEPCLSCEALCCREGQVFSFPLTQAGIISARQIIELNEGNFRGQKTSDAIIIELEGDCLALEGNSCSVHDQDCFPDVCRQHEPDGSWCTLK